MCGRKLAILRDRAGLTQEEVGNHHGWSQPKVARIESGISGMEPRELDELLELYGADQATREECHRLANLGRRQPLRRKSALRNRFEGAMRDVIDMEGSAAVVWRHNSMVIPGLLQTEDYMRYLFRAYRPALTREQIDRSTEDRLARQAVLDNADQSFWFVIHEAALRGMENVDGDTAVLKGQAHRLMEAIERPNIEVQVAPFRNGYYPGQAENYAIFGFDTEPPVQVTYVEKYDGGEIPRDEKYVARFATLWEHQRVHALGPEQTRPFVRDLTRPS
jgi:transcriptional regulator with XRE-family HTH domain